MYRILVLLLFPAMVQAQVNQIVGVVKDKNNKKPIPYVNIGIIDQAIGTVSDENGCFRLTVTDARINETLSFSHISYSTHQTGISTLIKDSVTIWMTPESNNIKDIIIKGGDQTFVGRKPTDDPVQGFFGIKGLGAEAGTVIYNEGPCQINNFQLNVLKSSFDELTFRLNFYQLKRNKPSKKMASPIIFRINKENKGIMTIDLKSQSIKVKGDFLVTIELIEMMTGSEEEPEFLFSAYQDDNTISFVKFISMDKWRRDKRAGLCFWMDVER